MSRKKNQRQQATAIGLLGCSHRRRDLTSAFVDVIDNADRRIALQCAQCLTVRALRRCRGCNAEMELARRQHQKRYCTRKCARSARRARKAAAEHRAALGIRAAAAEQPP